jgi:tRNA/tmRNA/rRNA uracil-C5-methylase (TrmA/RlmC/RlmD family)
MALPLDPCSHRPTCPGCPRYGEATLSPPNEALLQTLARETRAALLPLRTGARAGFRHRARLAVRGRRNSPKIGIFQEGTHRIADIPSCAVHHPAINAAVAAIKTAMRDSGISPYSEAPHKGELRYVQIVIERNTGNAQLVLVGLSPLAPGTTHFVELLKERLGDHLHSLWWNSNAERGNAILGAHWTRVSGPEAVIESIAGTQVFFPPGAFGQSHLALSEEIARSIRNAVPEGARVAEFYAGCGPIGLGLTRRAVEIRFNEISPHGLRGLELGLTSQAHAPGTPNPKPNSTQIHRGAAGECASMASDCDAVLVDPPRKGLDPALLRALIDAPPQILIYQSCGLPSLQRDLTPLLAGGALRLVSLEPFDLFPYTEHVEVVARLERK